MRRPKGRNKLSTMLWPITHGLRMLPSTVLPSFQGPRTRSLGLLVLTAPTPRAQPINPSFRGPRPAPSSRLSGKRGHPPNAGSSPALRFRTGCGPLTAWLSVDGRTSRTVSSVDVSRRPPDISSSNAVSPGEFGSRPLPGCPAPLC
jgi:hypothetical protein